MHNERVNDGCYMVKQVDDKRGLGDVVGDDGRILLRKDGGLKDFCLRLPKPQAERLAAMLDDAAGTPPGRTLTATEENLNRLRVVADPLPEYERRAGPEYVRGDVLRVTGSQKSCNISATRHGADLISARIRAVVGRAREWIEFRAKVVRYSPEEGPRSFVEVSEDVQVVAERDADALGRSGTALAGSVWTHEEFRDWEDAGA